MAVFETAYLQLAQPLVTDYVDVSIWNANMEKIDVFAGEITSTVQDMAASVYPKTEVDALLAEKADKSPATIQKGADLNDYTTVGTYISTYASVTNSLTNTPAGIGSNGFSLEVLRYANYPGIIQRVMWNEYITYLPHLCVRGGRLVDGSYTFGAWHHVAMTAETEA